MKGGSCSTYEVIIKSQWETTPLPQFFFFFFVAFLSRTIASGAVHAENKFIEYMNTCIELFLHNLDNNIYVIIYIRYCETSAISQYPVEWFLMSLKNGIFFGFFATSTSKLCCHDRSRELCYMMTPPLLYYSTVSVERISTRWGFAS